MLQLANTMLACFIECILWKYVMISGFIVLYFQRMCYGIDDVFFSFKIVVLNYSALSFQGYFFII